MKRKASTQFEKTKPERKHKRLHPIIDHSCLISKNQATKDERLYPLMNFMMAAGRDIDNWQYVQSLNLFSNDEHILYRGLQCDPNDVLFISDRCSSWSRSKEVAQHFGKTVLTCSFPNIFFIFDTRCLGDDLFSDHRWQEEIIIRPIEETDLPVLDITVFLGGNSP